MVLKANLKTWTAADLAAKRPPNCNDLSDGYGVAIRRYFLFLLKPCSTRCRLGVSLFRTSTKGRDNEFFGERPFVGQTFFAVAVVG